MGRRAQIEDSRLKLSSRPKWRDPENVSVAEADSGHSTQKLVPAAHQPSSASICGYIPFSGVSPTRYQSFLWGFAADETMAQF